jgi:cation diffusion facilitator CzcD-associated flavoprotein CzcO
VPPFAEKLDHRFWAHSADIIDFSRLAGKRVGVVGAGASAMDNAAAALEAGAARVDIFIRRKDIPRINKFTGIGSMGVIHGFAGLPDEWKWRFLDHTLSAQTPPPQHSVLRVSRHDNAFFHLGSPIETVETAGDHLEVITPRGSAEVDFMIFATGFRVDLESRPELAEFAGAIRLWTDRFSPPTQWELSGGADAELGGSPDLGDAFEFLEKVPGTCPALKHIHCFNFPATLSHGKLTGDIPAISEGADRLARGIVRSLFVEDRAVHFHNLTTFSTPELVGTEWEDTDMPMPAIGGKTHAAE